MNKLLTVILIILTSLTVSASDYVYSSDKGVKFMWVYDDPISIFADDGTMIALWAVDANGNNSNFSAYGWGLAPNCAFTAYAPFTTLSGDSPSTVLPMTYDGQMQMSNDDASHLYAYDYMKSDRTLSTDDALHFNLEHLGCVIRYEITLSSDQILTSLTLNTETPIVLDFDEIKVKQNAKLIAYMMVPPMTFGKKKVTLTLKNDNAEVAEMAMSGTEIVAGKCYPVALDCPDFISVSTEKCKAMKSGAAAAKKIPNSIGGATTATTILYPTAYAPDFLIDAERPLAQTTLKLVGDVNDDGEVMVDDAVLLVNHFLNRTTDELDPEVADLNNDGDIDVADAVAIVNIYLNTK